MPAVCCRRPMCGPHIVDLVFDTMLRCLQSIIVAGNPHIQSTYQKQRIFPDGYLALVNSCAISTSFVCCTDCYSPLKTMRASVRPSIR